MTVCTHKITLYTSLDEAETGIKSELQECDPVDSVPIFAKLILPRIQGILSFTAKRVRITTYTMVKFKMQEVHSFWPAEQVDAMVAAVEEAIANELV